MALHIIYVRIAPEDPIILPTMVKSVLESMKPSAQSAHPE